MGQVRETKKQETRQRISDVATALFSERGFEDVTVDEIAAAAKVSKMTVFNYFSRKEELMLDREDDLKLRPFRLALRERAADQSPVDALRALIARMSEQKHPLTHVSKQVVGWWRLIDASPSLRARLRELADEAMEELALELGGPQPSGNVKLAAGLVVMTVRTARAEAVRHLELGASAKRANAVFLDLMELGLGVVDLMLSKVSTTTN